MLGKRDDGFHEIETLMVPISLCDSLSFCPDPSGRISLECQWADPSATAALGALPAEADNLATKAARLLRERAGIEAGAALRLVKRIPAAAGLGGGSSDAAAALVAGNIAWGLNWPLERLMPLAAELGSDVPFFLGRGARDLPRPGRDRRAGRSAGQPSRRRCATTGGIEHRGSLPALPSRTSASATRAPGGCAAAG